jgi:hypothetical protein
MNPKKILIPENNEVSATLLHQEIFGFCRTSLSLQNFSCSNLFMIYVFIDSHKNDFSFLLRSNSHPNLNHFTLHCQDFKKPADLKKELKALDKCAQWKNEI